jgi:hypothetical protein
MNRHALFAGTVALALSFAAQAQVQVFGGTEERQCARVFYYSQSDKGFQTHGQLSIDYGAPTWKKEYEKEEMMKKVQGKRWRFGTGPWTCLDTNVALDIGGTHLAPGSYYLVLEIVGDGKINLIVLDPAKVREKKLDASAASATTEGTSIPMKWEKGKDAVEKLSIELHADESAPQNVTLEVRWGPHMLTADIKAKVDGSGA